MTAKAAIGRTLALGGLIALAVSAFPDVSSGAPRALWGSGDVPADLVQEAEPDLGTNIDAGAHSFADVDNASAPGSDGCGAVTVYPDNRIAFFITGGETMPTEFTDGVLCDLPGGGQELRLFGDTTNADGSTVLGTAEAHFYRTGPAAAFTRFELDLTDGRCYTVGSLSGYPGDGTAPDDYVIQGWNFAADPSVDCSARQLPPPTTSSTSTSSIPTTSTVPTGSSSSTTSTTATPGATQEPPASAQPASAVAGTPTFTG